MRTITITEPTESIDELVHAVAMQSESELIDDLARDVASMDEISIHEARIAVAGCVCNLPVVMRLQAAKAGFSACTCPPDLV